MDYFEFREKLGDSFSLNSFYSIESKHFNQNVPGFRLRDFIGKVGVHDKEGTIVGPFSPIEIANYARR